MENNDLLQKLKEWRTMAAGQEGIALFRVLPNKTLEDIARLKPTTKEDILTIKGIKEKKFGKYGKDILALINENQEGRESSIYNAQENVAEKLISVSKYLSLLNNQLCQQKARVKGEISSLDIKENYLSRILL